MVTNVKTKLVAREEADRHCKLDVVEVVQYLPSVSPPVILDALLASRLGHKQLSAHAHNKQKTAQTTR